MRAMRTMRVPTAAKLAVGATVLAFPATAVAMTNSTGTASHDGSQPAAALHAARPVAARYGHRTIVHGSAPVAAAGLPIELRYRPAGALSWQIVARGHVHANGHFALSARVARSGGLQVIAARGASVTRLSPTPPAFASIPFGPTQQLVGAARGISGATNTTAATAATGADALSVVPSPVRHLIVKPKLALSDRHGDTTAVAGQPTQIRGHLLPGIAGRKVVLEVQHDHRWIRAGAARTRAGGAFDLHYVPAATSRQRLQVAFAGDRFNGHADSTPQSVTPMQYAEVSWYEDAGNTACGFHATYGIASRTLPCGSKVTLSYGGRSVVATVDDRGPFVYSRLYDLDQTTAGALGMNGVATVLASI
jgi:rare lipoprotein A